MAGSGELPEVRLVSHCRRYNGWLVSLESVRAGIGPQRAAVEHRAAVALQPTSLTLFDIAA